MMTQASESRKTRTRRIDTVVIGGGQAGLAISYYLTQQGREHVVLEKDRVAEAWRSKKWDTFTLVTPNWTVKLPGMAYAGGEPDGFMTRDAVVRMLDDYVAMVNPPLRLGVTATSVTGRDEGAGYIVATDAGTLVARNVVIATGTFQRPKIPAFAQAIAPDIVQLHTTQYRNADHLPPGAVLVVGSGQSGCQIADELRESGRKVYLCTGKAGRAPRRYRGKDYLWWLVQMGIAERTVDQLRSPARRFQPNPQVTGKNGGYTLNLHQFALDGITLLGRLRGAAGHSLRIGDELMENLTASDAYATRLESNIDKYIAKSGVDAPGKEDRPVLRAGYDADVLRELDLAAAGIHTVIWATGYRFDYSLARFPIFDSYGYPVQQRGVTSQPGLYFLGMHWLHTIKSGIFFGIAEDAAHIADHIARRSG